MANPMKLEKTEIYDLIISWLTISIAFGWVFSGGLVNIGSFPFVFLITAVGVGTGFIFHELAHRYTAIHFGASAKYKVWMSGLVFALLMAFFTGFVFAAPGAVYITGNISRKENGLISLAGPAINFTIFLLFTIIAAFIEPENFFHILLGFAARINLFLGVFNMIPFGPLDGSKVFVWNPLVWGALFVPGALLLFI